RRPRWAMRRVGSALASPPSSMPRLCSPRNQAPWRPRSRSLRRGAGEWAPPSRFSRVSRSAGGGYRWHCGLRSSSLSRSCAAQCARSRDARPLVAILWTLIAFLPASNLLTATGQILAERTLYVSSIGVAMLVAWGLDRIFALAPTPADASGTRVRRQLVSIAAAMAVAVACIRGFVRTRDYAGVWRTHMSLFSAMVRADSLSYRGYELLAIEYTKKGQPGEA